MTQGTGLLIRAVLAEESSPVVALHIFFGAGPMIWYEELVSYLREYRGVVDRTVDS